MKATIIASVVALAGLVVTSSTINAQQNQSQGTLVAVIDVAEVFEKHAGFEARMSDIKSEVERFDQDLKAKQADLISRAEQLQTLTPGTPSFTQLETSLAREEADLQIEAAQKRKDVLDREALIYLETYTEVTNAVASIADANGIMLVLRYDRSEIDPTDRGSVIKGVNRNVVLNRGYDLTDMVVQIVNQQAAEANNGRNGTIRQ